MSEQKQTNETTSPEALSAEAREELKDAIHELSDSMTRIAAERDLQKNLLEDTYNNLGVNKSLIKTLAKVYNKSNFAQEKDKYNTLEEFYEILFEKRN